MDFKSLTKLEQQEIIEVLDQFGLGEKDRQVYFALLKSDKTTVSPLAKRVRFPVTTVQSVLGRLEKRGLLKVTTQKSRHSYEAEDPIILKKLLKRKIQDVNNILPFLKKLKAKDTAEAKIRVYYRARMADIFHQALESQDKLVYEIVSAKDLQNILGEKFHFTRRRVQQGVHLKSLRVEKWEIKKYNQNIHERELREAKFLPRELTFQASIMFWDNTIAFFSTKEEGLAWIVESKATTEMMKQIFELLWSVSRKMETISEKKT